jgi:hypothetical protein
MISMAGSKSQFNTSMHCVASDAHNVAEAARILADVAQEAGAYFDVDVD